MAFDAEWYKMDLLARLKFCLDWQTKPGAQWTRVKTIDSTKTLLNVLQDIAEQRSNIEVFQKKLGSAFDISKINASYPINPATVADTDGVVQSEPRHAGGWWGLLGLNPDAVAAEVFVVGGYPMRMPPATAGFLSVLRHLTTTAGASPEGMVTFVSAERKTVGKKGLHHLALTFFYLVQENGDDLVAKYLKALRGHSPDEVGSVHHMGDLLKFASDVDERYPSMLMALTLDKILKRFPLIFSKSGKGSSDMTDEVAKHLNLWSLAIGNHPEALKWLKDELTRHRKSWSDPANMAAVLKQDREKERTVLTSRTSVLTKMLSEVRTVRTELQKAVTNGVAKERMNTLTNAKTKVDGWRKKTGTSTTTSVGGGGGSETTVDGDILIVEGSEKVTVNFSTKLDNTIADEKEEMGSTTDTETRAMSDKLTTSWQQVITESKAYEDTIKQETTRSESKTDAVTRSYAVNDAFGQQVKAILAGIDIFMSAQHWTLPQ